MIRGAHLWRFVIVGNNEFKTPLSKMELSDVKE